MALFEIISVLASNLNFFSRSFLGNNFTSSLPRCDAYVSEKYKNSNRTRDYLSLKPFIFYAHDFLEFSRKTATAASWWNSTWKSLKLSNVVYVVKHVCGRKFLMSHNCFKRIFCDKIREHAGDSCGLKINICPHTSRKFFLFISPFSSCYD